MQRVVKGGPPWFRVSVTIIQSEGGSPWPDIKVEVYIMGIKVFSKTFYL